MNFSEYQKISLETEPQPEHYQKVSKKLESLRAVRLLHGIIGIAGEVGELEEHTSRENFIEECGDILWYTSITLDSLNLTFKDLQLPETASTSLINSSISETASTVVDIFKRHSFYSQPLNQEGLVSSLSKLIQILQSKLVFVYEATLEEAMQGNYEKLNKKRYKNGFSTQAAAERADKK